LKREFEAFKTKNLEEEKKPIKKEDKSVPE
jgi:hypothetical protein